MSIKTWLSRRGYPDMFLGKGVLKTCSKFTGEHQCWSVIWIKLLVRLFCKAAVTVWQKRKSKRCFISVCYVFYPENLCFLSWKPYYNIGMQVIVFLKKNMYIYICPCSFYFHSLMLVALREGKLLPLNDTGKDWKLTTDFEKILTFSLARGFDLDLSSVVTILLINPVMVISWPCIFEKECFDMLKSIGFEIWSEFFQVWQDLIGSTLVDLCQIWLGSSLGCKLRDDQ